MKKKKIIPWRIKCIDELSTLTEEMIIFARKICSDPIQKHKVPGITIITGYKPKELPE